MQLYFDDHYPNVPNYFIRRSDLQPRHMPEYSAVYIVIDRQRRVEYVGETKNLRHRISEHGGFSHNSGIAWINVDSSMLAFTECWFIATLRPYRNGTQRKYLKDCSRSAVVDRTIHRLWVVGRHVRLCDGTSGFIDRVYESSKRIVVNGVSYRICQATVTLA
jgi:hypothetical protein